MSEVTFLDYIAMNNEEQDRYDADIHDAAPILDNVQVEAMMGAVALGTAFSLSDVICKLFRFVLRIAKQVIAVVSEVVKDLVGATFEILGEVLSGASSALFSSPLGIIIVAGLGLWLASRLGLFGASGKDEDDEENVVREYHYSDYSRITQEEGTDV